MNITKNFSTVSDPKIFGQSTKMVENVFRIIDHLELTIRHKFGTTIITSGLREKSLNDTLDGSAKNSQHLTGEAMDYYCPGKDIKEVFEWAKNNCDYDQLILELDQGVIHHSLKENNNRKQVLVRNKVNGNLVYEPV